MLSVKQIEYWSSEIRNTYFRIRKECVNDMEKKVNSPEFINEVFDDLEKRIKGLRERALNKRDWDIHDNDSYLYIRGGYYGFDIIDDKFNKTITERLQVSVKLIVDERDYMMDLIHSDITEEQLNIVQRYCKPVYIGCV